MSSYPPSNCTTHGSSDGYGQDSSTSPSTMRNHHHDPPSTSNKSNSNIAGSVEDNNYSISRFSSDTTNSHSQYEYFNRQDSVLARKSIMRSRLDAFEAAFNRK